MRIAILWKQMSGFAAATFAALRDLGTEVLLVHRSATADAPFNDDRLDLGIGAWAWTQQPGDAELAERVAAFDPHAVLVISWDVGVYRRLSRSLQGRTLRILCMDNAWLGTPKQWAGRLAAPWLIRPTYDAAFLPGDRQAAFARYLGFPDERILWGLNTCDHAALAKVAAARAGDLPERFLFTGRLVPEKGIDVLASAYATYCESSARPWPLTVCGTGPLASAFDGLANVELLGFVQPGEIGSVYARAGCLVMPSRFEPWGVAIHEATSAGLPVICTSACGASSRLVLDGFNGALVSAGEAAALAAALARIADPATDRATLGRHSTELALQFTPQRWAGYLTERVTWLRRHLGLDRG